LLKQQPVKRIKKEKSMRAQKTGGRLVKILLYGVTLFSSWQRFAFAQDYPNKPLTLCGLRPAIRPMRPIFLPKGKIPSNPSSWL
jgi:hypothetical protein